jgi:hypothetical protein
MQLQTLPGYFSSEMQWARLKTHLVIHGAKQAVVKVQIRLWATLTGPYDPEV